MSESNSNVSGNNCLTGKSEEEIKFILEGIKICVDSKVRIASENELIKETLKSLKDEYSITKKQLTKLVNVAFKQNYETEIAEQEEFQELYEKIIKNATK